MMGRVIMSGIVPTLKAPRIPGDPATALTWVFDESPVIPIGYSTKVSISFTAGGATYSSISVQGGEGLTGEIYFDDGIVYTQRDGTFAENMRTIGLYAPATGDALTLLKRFATPK